MGCEVADPPKKASGSILKAFPEKADEADRAVHPDLKVPDGEGIDGVAPDLKPLEPGEPEAAPAEPEPAPEPDLHPDLKAFPAK